MALTPQLVLVLVAALFARSSAHGAVTKPMPRKLASEYFCPWCIGEHQPDQNPPPEVYRDALPSSPCMGTSRSDPPYTIDSWGGYKDLTGPAEPSYSPGGSLQATIVLNADHNGDAYWSYCPHSEAESEACFQSHPLTEWASVSDCGHHCQSGEHFSETVPLPSETGMVTLRWLWVCKLTDEIFVSCIDVNMGGADGQVSAPADPVTTTALVAPSTPPTSAPAASEPTSAPASGPSVSSPSSGSCAGDYQQCGGQDWTGTTCCATAGWVCKSANDWHSQCEPAEAATSPNEIPAEPASPAIPTCCAAARQQCGGEAFQGPSCCQAGSTCIVISSELFQCVPDCEVAPDAQRAPAPSAAALLQSCAEVAIRRHDEVAADALAEPTGSEGRRAPRGSSERRFLAAAPALLQLAANRSLSGDGMVAGLQQEL